MNTVQNELYSSHFWMFLSCIGRQFRLEMKSSLKLG